MDYEKTWYHGASLCAAQVRPDSCCRAAACSAACGVKKASSSGGGASGTLKIGYVSPQTGEAAGFGEPDGWILSQVRKAIAGGITGADGKHYTITILEKDSQSSPQAASVGGQRPHQQRRHRPDADQFDTRGRQPGLRRL